MPQTPEEFAKQLGGAVSTQPSEVSLTIRAPEKSDTTVDPETFAKQLGGTVDSRIQEQTTPDNAIVTSDTPWDHFWRSMYAAIPDVTGAIGAGLGGTFGATSGAALGTVALPGVGTVGGGGAGAVLGAEAGAGAGGVVGRGIQQGIDTLFDRPSALQNPRNVGEEVNRQMLFETAGRAFGGLVDRFLPTVGLGRGQLAPKTSDVADRLATNQQYGLRLSPGEITGSPGISRVERLAQRGIGGFSRQKAAQARTDAAAQKAINGILTGLGAPGTSTGAGAAVQDVVQSAADRGARRLEGSVASNLASKTGLGTAGQTAEAGVQAGRTAFARQSDQFGKMVNEAPQVDVTPLHDEALRIFNDEIMPALIENPSLGPKNNADWQKVVRAYITASKNGSRLELGPATRKALADSALEKASYGPLRIINQVLATPAEMSFRGALNLRGTLRDAGKGTDLIAADKAQALASYFETGSRTSQFQGIRGILNETHAPYQAAAEAYATNRSLFQSAFVEKVADSNPESVLATLTNAEGRFNASRIRQMSQVLQTLPKTYGTPDEVQAGEKAWNTLRAEWFRRDIMQDNVFGLSDRLSRVDPDVLQAWFPDVAGKNVMKQAQVTASAFESHLLGQLAEADPAKIVDMIGTSAKNVNEFKTRIAGLPGPVQKQPLIDRVRRAWTETNLTTGDTGKIADRIAKTDPDLLKAWFPPELPVPANASPQAVAAINAENAKRQVDLQALQNLRRLGAVLSDRRQVTGFGAYESLGLVTVASSLLKGNFKQALTTTVGFEGIPAFLSWAMYNPGVQKYLFDASAPGATVTSKTAALLRAVGAWRASQTEDQPKAQGTT